MIEQYVLDELKKYKEENEQLKKYYDYMKRELDISKSIVLEDLLR